MSLLLLLHSQTSAPLTDVGVTQNYSGPVGLRANGTGSVSSNSQVTSLAVPIGAGVVAGDILYIVGSWNTTVANTTFTTPTGWSVVSTTTDSGPSSIVSVGTFTKVSDGTEAGTTVTLAHSTTGRCAAVSAAFSGSTGTLDPSYPAVTSDNGASGGQTSQSSPTLTGMSQTTDIAILLMGAKQDVASATPVTFTQPSGYTVAVQASGSSSAGNNGASAIAYKIKGDASDETSPGWTTNEAVHWLSESIPLTTRLPLDSIAKGTPRPLTDTGTTNTTSSVVSNVTRSLTDTGAAQSDSLVKTISRRIRRNLGSGLVLAPLTSAGGTALDTVSAVDTMITSGIHGGAVLGVSSSTLTWHASLGGTLTDGYARIYAQLGINGIINTTLGLMIGRLSGVSVWQISVSSTPTGIPGQINIVQSGTQATSTFSVGTSPFRLEVHHNSASQLVVRIFAGANVEGSTPDETLTAAANTANNVDQIDFFSNGFAIEDIVAGATGFPGPAPGSANGGLTNSLSAITLDSLIATKTPGSGSNNISITDTGVTNTDSLVLTTTHFLIDTGTSNTATLVLTTTHPLTDTGTTNTAALALTTTHSCTDTGTTNTATLVLTTTHSLADTGTTNTATLALTTIHPLTTTGTTNTESIILTTTHPITTTGTTNTESLTTTHTFIRSLTDTGTTNTASMVLTTTHPLTDTGSSISDSIATIRQRAVTDTGVTLSDSLVTIRARPPTDTGTTFSEALVLRTTHSFSDTGTTNTDSFGHTDIHPITDTGTTNTTTLVLTTGHSLTDTGTTNTATLVITTVHPLTDTGTTNTAALGLTTVHNITDTGTTNTATLALATIHSLTDTGVTNTDSLVIQHFFAVPAVAGLGGLYFGQAYPAQSLPLKTPSYFALNDNGTIFSESLTLTTTHSITDTGTTNTATLVLTSIHSLTDTGTTNTDSLGHTDIHPITDTGTTNTTTLALTVTRSITTTGTTNTESLVSTHTYIRSLTDTGTTNTESIVLRVTRSLSDTGTTNTASLAVTQAGSGVGSGTSATSATATGRATVKGTATGTSATSGLATGTATGASTASGTSATSGTAVGTVSGTQPPITQRKSFGNFTLTGNILVKL